MRCEIKIKITELSQLYLNPFSLNFDFLRYDSCIVNDPITLLNHVANAEYNASCDALRNNVIWQNRLHSLQIVYSHREVSVQCAWSREL